MTVMTLIEQLMEMVPVVVELMTIMIPLIELFSDNNDAIVNAINEHSDTIHPSCTFSVT